MAEQVRGISIHTCGGGLSYYVHYEDRTEQVDEETLLEALDELQLWRAKMEIQQRKPGTMTSDRKG